MTGGVTVLSVPQVGWLVVSVAITRGTQSLAYVGNDSCTEQPHPARSASVNESNFGVEAILATLPLPPHGGAPSSVQVPLPVLSWAIIGAAAPVLISQVASKYRPVLPGCEPA